MKLEKNEGGVDRVVRVVLGIALLVASAGASGLWIYVIAVIGLIAIITGVVGYCPAYKLIGITTTKKTVAQTPPPSQPAG